MIAAVCIGRHGSKGFPRKNLYEINKTPMFIYPLQAAWDCSEVDYVYFSTDSQEMKDKIPNFFSAGIGIIDRPEELATNEALGEDVFVHAYKQLKHEVEFVVLLFANAPCITSSMMSEMIEMLRSDEIADSICTVSKYNMFSPERMRRVHEARRRVFNVIPPSSIQSNCDRNSAGDYYIYDCSCAIVRPKCLQDISYGHPPQPWLGRSVMYYEQKIPALDLDYEWQVGQIEYWLKKCG